MAFRVPKLFGIFKKRAPERIQCKMTADAITSPSRVAEPFAMICACVDVLYARQFFFVLALISWIYWSILCRLCANARKKKQTNKQTKGREGDLLSE